jgi:hypothetical protein
MRVIAPTGVPHAAGVPVDAMVLGAGLAALLVLLYIVLRAWGLTDDAEEE